MTGASLLLASLLGVVGSAVGYALSAILLTGRFGSWSACLAPRHPGVAIATGLLWCAIGAWSLAGGMAVSLLPGVLALTSAGVVLTVIDVRHHRLPNAVVWRGAVPEPLRLAAMPATRLLRASGREAAHDQ